MTFGLTYLANFQRQRGRDLGVLLSANALLPRAAEDVAELFIAKLLACRL